MANAIATVALDGPVKVISVRGTAFDAAQPGGQAQIEKVGVNLDAASKKMQFMAFNETKSDRPNLTEARIVVSGGRGLKSGENFTIYLEPLVDAALRQSCSKHTRTAPVRSLSRTSRIATAH